MASYVEVVAPHLGAALVDAQARAALDRLLMRLPPACPAGFECRLAPGASRVDFQFQVRRLPENWSELASQFDRSIGEDQELDAAILGIWVELDVPSQGSLPSLIFRLAPEIRQEAALRLAAAFLPSPRVTELRASLARIQRLLPERAEVSHLGAMLGRDGTPGAFRVSNLAREDVSSLFRGLGERALADALDEASERIVSECSSFALLLDGALGPRVGLECFVTASESAAWGPALERLQRRGLAAESKAEAVMRWPGVQARRPGCPWPANIARGDALLGSRAISAFTRRINHLKLVFAGTLLDSAKAYLAFEHQWVAA
jgi:hypothetical protein